MYKDAKENAGPATLLNKIRYQIQRSTFLYKGSRHMSVPGRLRNSTYIARLNWDVGSNYHQCTRRYKARIKHVRIDA